MVEFTEKYERGAQMKVLFAIRDAVRGQQSLKAHAWYHWY
ncbi:tryptorubin family RiPP precursor [Kitasatospora azatica]